MNWSYNSKAVKTNTFRLWQTAADRWDQALQRDGLVLLDDVI